MGRGNFAGFFKGRSIVKYRDTMRSRAKMAEPIEMPFALWARMGRRNHALIDGGPAVVRDVVMATNFWRQFAINGFVGYNFGCVIASNTCLILGFWGQAS